MCVKFKTSENILDWIPVIFQNSMTSEVFCYSRKAKREPMNPIESELDAIERIKYMKEAHQELGIIKSPRFYDYAKLAIMEMNDHGFVSTEEHFFKDSNDCQLFMSYN